ncbi:MAG: hypothetical protein KatS3mg068_0245 [Candidatus Sericytochromatia bacterium]|nr:MAG: hypothetical protein KatS3mg068_0245 [Candidatus Sericytochromatia bacterium]
MFLEKDFLLFKEHGITQEEVLKQIEIFKKGTNFVNLVKYASINDGIIKLNNEEIDYYINIFEKSNLSKIKFVPASGAATRMFKSLLYFYNNYEEISYNNLKDNLPKDNTDFKELEIFIKNLSEFAFYNDLKNIMKLKDIDIDFLIRNDKYKLILEYLLTEKGLNYSNLPKAFIKFHKYENEERTSFEEHFIEGINYSNNSGKVKLHFTLSEEHLNLGNLFLEKLKNKYNKYIFDVTFTIQAKSTDTISVNLENKPFRDKKGNILFRPGGHGALINNLNTINDDIIFIKNIDNVVHDKLKKDTYKYKKCLAGYLIEIRNKVFKYLNLIENNYSESLENEIVTFMKKDLFIDVKENSKSYIYQKLNRPIRVCGVVKNTGEPGGGPFWVKNSKGELSLQIVETSQINRNDKEQLNILNSSTHFNPVDIVCSIKDYKDNKFELSKFVDNETYFISNKSKDGIQLKALELPGLWNGAMSDWITIFIEVPLTTFNPVKTINDLLRKEHNCKLL